MRTANQAWITFALDDELAKKSLILSGSLRRSRTAKKTVVMVSSTVSDEFIKYLNEAFDLVLPLETTPDGLKVEDDAIVKALALVIFGKCVFMPPTSLVLKNCDEIFERFENFAASTFSDSPVFAFVPSLMLSQGVRKGLLDARVGEIYDDNALAACLKYNVDEIEKLDDKFHAKCYLDGDNRLSLTTQPSIVSFVDVHPLDIDDKIDVSDRNLGPIEKFYVDYGWAICHEVFKNKVKSSSEHLRYQAEPIAVVGLSFRLPGAKDIDEFWALLSEGKDAVVPVPSHRWTKEQSISFQRNSKFEAGFLNVPIDEFDGKFFGLSPKEVEYLDPQQRLLMEVTWEALEDAMIDPLKLRGTRTGVFVGSWLQDYKEMLSRSVDVDFFRTYMGNSFGASAARLSHFLETTGPSIGTESGCSAAIAAVDMACKSLRNGESSFAIAAGVHLLLLPVELKIMDFVLSPDYRCKTFDEKANGFARAEGCAVLLLKRLSDAVRDGDSIWGLIRGTALTQEGVSKSLGTPTEYCESLAMQLALQDGGVDPKDVSFVECHGTGTAVGDPLEISAITKAYSKGRIEPLWIGSVKTNVGHTESVSGITGIIKVLLSMKNEAIPRHIHLEKLNPRIDLSAIPAEIPLTTIPWLSNNTKKRIAGVSSFGLSGCDGHAILEEPPAYELPEPKFGKVRPLHVMKLSAKSVESLDLLIQKHLSIFNHKAHINIDNEKEFANYAYSMNVGRATLSYRAVITARNFCEAAKILEEKSFLQSDVQTTGSKLCFLFTGQGSQYPNMAKELYETSPVFSDAFNRCDELLRRRHQISIKNIVWPNSENADDINKSLYSQTSIFVVQYCLLKLWESWDVKPDYVLGHSLGEFAAAVAAGILSLEDAIMLVAERSLLIQSLPIGKMLVVKAGEKTLDEAVLAFQEIMPTFSVDFAALNSPEQTVVAGNAGMIDEFAKFCKQQSLMTFTLPATHAFHSRHMDSILSSYKDIALSVVKAKPGDHPQYISGVEGKLVNTNSVNADYWVRHTREKVNFIGACAALQPDRHILFIEIGPHPVLSALVMKNLDGHQVTCLPSVRRKEEVWVTLLGSLAKLYLSDWKGEIDWKGFDRFYGRNKVKLPFYPFNRRSFWTHLEPEHAKIHPLIGGVLPTASNEVIFQNTLTMKNAGFVRDHVIGDTVVFPGAAFLEMCIAGGHSAMQADAYVLLKPNRKVHLKSLKILQPMALRHSESCKIQTLVTLNDKHDVIEDMHYSVGVYRHSNSENESEKWIQHASAIFLPVSSTVPSQLLEPIDINKIRTNWSYADNKSFYEKLPDVGLRFGPSFQSLECKWWSSGGILASLKVFPDHTSYILHPLLADAMIQVFSIWTRDEDNLKKKLQVPVHIEDFIWLKDTDTSTRFVYCANNENDDPYCLLLDESGNTLAYMRGVQLVETTAKLVEGMIAQQSSMMPKLWEEVWRNSPGPMQGYLCHDSPLENLEFSKDEIKIFSQVNNIPEDELQFCQDTSKLACLSVFKALLILGWKPKLGETYSVDFILQQLNILQRFKQYIHFFLRSLATSDLKIIKIVNTEETSFALVAPPPTLLELEALPYLTNPEKATREEYRLSKAIDGALSRILTGEVDPLSILFPDNPNLPNAGSYYKSVREQVTFLPAKIKTNKHVSNAEQCYLNNPMTSRCRPIYRALEIGAGTGLFSKEYLQDFLPSACKECEIEFYWTDITAAFFNSAEAELGDSAKHVVFKKFDMEKDPLMQGLCPGYFDAIIAFEVLHIAKDIKRTLRTVRSLLKPGGMIIISETLLQDLRITFNFGLLKSYWLFNDTELRRGHATLPKELWKKVLIETGFYGVSIIPVYNNEHGIITAFGDVAENNFLLQLGPPNHSWIIFGDNEEFCTKLQKKIVNVNRNCLIVSKPDKTELFEESMGRFFQSALCAAMKGVDSLEGVVYLWSLSPNTRDQREVSLPFVTLMQVISGLTISPKIFAVMKGALAIETSVVIDPTPGTLAGLCKSLMNEYLNMSIICLDLDPYRSTLDQLDELFMNLWVEHKQSAAFRNGHRLRPKITTGKIMRHEPLSLPGGCDRFQLALPSTKLISDLEFVFLERYEIVDNEIEILVKAIALNFKDVFVVLKPSRAFEKSNSVGLDFSGVITKVGRGVKNFKTGDRVMGLNTPDNVSLPSHLKVPEGIVMHLPPQLTFDEGATLPVAFSTAFYCLIKRAKMKKGETVLIHTASGGVGLVAIQLCKYVGCNIIATAGAPRKRNYLKNLGIKHVFHSRTTNFKEGILEATKGLGVDIVLNSLTGPGFKEASLDVLGKRGRFVEMSKLNVWTKQEVQAFRPDVKYELVDLTVLETHEIHSLTDELVKFLKDGYIKPLPYERFDGLNIRGALNYLQKAHHIGKIVCAMPEVNLENSNLIVSAPLFNEDCTYLVTGGLGGIGFEVVKWMLNRGAKHIAIMSRSSPKSDTASQIETWNRTGKHVEAFSVDVGDYQKCKETFEKILKPTSGFPKLKGVMHAAGVLHDAVFENQSWDTFSCLFNPKVNGSWNLHDLTMDYQLEHFVFFSSIASTLGSPGQSNHSASNSFEDSLSAYRRSNGLPATCVMWGNWGEVGIATQIDYAGVRPISTAQGLSTLEVLLKTQTSQMAVFNVDAFTHFKKIFPQLKHYVEDSSWLAETKVSLMINADEFWNQVDSATDRKGKEECFTKLAETVVRNILKIDHSDKIDDQAELHAIGMDSLMMLEMKNGMQNVLGSRVTFTASQLRDCNTIRVLANTLVDILEGQHEEANRNPSIDELKQLIYNDSHLIPDTISVENLTKKRIDQVETVLLTGATGFLGPYVLRELTQKHQVKQVFCLIRPSGKVSGIERLKSRLVQLQILDTVDFGKVVVVDGDITVKKFGLNDDTYLNLCEKIDAIVHNAVKMDYFEKYWKAPETNKAHVRTVNVLGTVRILEFAAERTLKYFFHASSMLSFCGTGVDGKYSESWQAVTALDEQLTVDDVGYLISKHISEQLVYKASLKGVPCKAFRFPVISGDSKTGRLDYQQNYTYILWMTCLKLRIIHDLPIPMVVIPVDHCAKISIDIFFNPEAPTNVYNILQRTYAVEQGLAEVAGTFGIEMKIVSLEEFMDKLRSKDRNDSISQYVNLYLARLSKLLSRIEKSSNCEMSNWFQAGDNLLMDTGNYAPSYEDLIESSVEVLQRDFKYLRDAGVFEEVGIAAGV